MGDAAVDPHSIYPFDDGTRERLRLANWFPLRRELMPGPVDHDRA